MPPVAGHQELESAKEAKDNAIRHIQSRTFVSGLPTSRAVRTDSSSTCVISIYRIRTLKTAAATKDPNWDNVDAAIWSFIEVTNAIIAACLPTLRPLMSRLMPQIFGSSLGRSNRASSYGQSFDGRFQRNQARIRIISHDKEASEDEYILCDDNAPSSSITKGTHDSHRPAVSVSIEAGNRVFDEKNEVHIRGMEGITTRTVITQQVASELIPEEGDCEVRDTKL